ncbi:hypothetical protein HDU67_001574 [Dinochytrium kinnereticum]|nr:hypothetical protein HDU67_001574 [Dinochytrium kinnereticum]
MNPNEDAQSTEELTAFVEQILKQMQTKFEELSSNVLGRMEEMGSRIGDLEKSVNELVSETSLDGEASGADPASSG